MQISSEATSVLERYVIASSEINAAQTHDVDVVTSGYVRPGS